MQPGFSFGPVTAGRMMLIVVLALGALLLILAGAGRLTSGGDLASGAMAHLRGEPPTTGSADLPADQVYRRSVEGVVKIVAYDEARGTYATAPGEAGTGFVISQDGRIVTCAHVVSPAGSPVSRVRVAFRVGEVGERTVDGVVVGVDTAGDIAVVRVDPDTFDLTALPLGDAGALEVGDTVYSIGNPLGYDFSMTRGIVSALHRVLLGPNDATIRDGIQTDAAVNVGDSGGPLLDAQGMVVGVNEQIATPGGAPTGSAGLAFAVPVSTVRDVLRQLRATGRVVRPWIGVEALTITPVAVQVLGLEAEHGFVLVDVTAGGPAAAAGLEGGDRVVAVPGQPGRTVAVGGDVVTALDGRPVSGTDDLVACVQALKPGDRLPVTYLRDGRTMTTVIVVGVRPAP